MGMIDLRYDSDIENFDCNNHCLYQIWMQVKRQKEKGQEAKYRTKGLRMTVSCWNYKKKILSYDSYYTYFTYFRKMISLDFHRSTCYFDSRNFEKSANCTIRWPNLKRMHGSTKMPAYNSNFKNPTLSSLVKKQLQVFKWMKSLLKGRGGVTLPP